MGRADDQLFDAPTRAAMRRMLAGWKAEGELERKLADDRQGLLQWVREHHGGVGDALRDDDPYVIEQIRLNLEALGHTRPERS